MSKFRYLEKELVFGGHGDSSDEDGSDLDSSSQSDASESSPGGPTSISKGVKSDERFGKLFSLMKNDEGSEDDEDDLSTNDSSSDEGEGNDKTLDAVLEDSDEEVEHASPKEVTASKARGAPLQGSTDLDASLNDVEEQSSDDDENIDVEKLRSGPLGDIVEEMGQNGKPVFRCKICTTIKLNSDRDVVTHLQGKGHRKAFINQKKANWTAEMVEAKRKRNREKNKRRRARQEEEGIASKDSKTKGKRQQEDNKSQPSQEEKSSKKVAKPLDGPSKTEKKKSSKRIPAQAEEASNKKKSRKET